jgi:cellobiose phosphorylase
LLHCGDWNDLLDKAGIKGKGEGVWMSFALARVLKIVGQVAAWRGDKKVQKLCETRYKVLSKNIMKHGWDGQHFIYAINDAGTAVGSRKSREGRIFINPQSWSILSGVVDVATYRKIAERIEPEVDTPVGPAQNWPPFTTYDHGIGQLSGTPPGYFTNGNVYCHAAAFKIAADYAAGRNDKAFDTFKKILPTAEKSEPFAQANGYVGPTAQRLLLHVSDDPWRTGTVAWNFLNAVDGLLGFERTLEGFHLRPKLPSTWPTAHVVRPFRGINFEIKIVRAEEPRITVDGKPIEGDFIPVPRAKPGAKARAKTVQVLCEIAA